MKMPWKLSLTFGTLLLALVPASVSQTCTVTVSPSRVAILAGGSQQFTATVLPASCSQSIKWRASAGTITNAGLLTAPVSTTQTVITVQAKQAKAPGTFGASRVTVTPITSITVTPSSASNLVGNTVQFTATGTFGDGTTQNLTTLAAWASSSVGVANVSAGLATGVSSGATTVTATWGLSGNAGLTITQPNPVVPNTFFGMDISRTNAVGGISTDPWPSNGGGVNFGLYRSLGSQIMWNQIETCEGGPDPTNSCYTWTRFDAWRNQMQTGDLGQVMMFTAYRTPKWATPNPNDVCNGSHDGACDLPLDVTTTDQLWKDFLTALFTHVGPGGIQYLEIWNEPNIATECNPPDNGGNCTVASLVQMTKDAQCVVKGIGTGCGPALDANVQIVSPAPTSTEIDNNCIQEPATISGYLGSMLAAGIAGYADIIGFHGYIHLPPAPPQGSGFGDPASGAACINDLINDPQAGVRTVVWPYTNKPIFDTEGSWGEDDQRYLDLKNNTWIRTNPGQETAFTGIYYLLQGSNSVCPAATACNPLAGAVWFGWDPPSNGQFWDPTLGPNGTLNLAGTAYQNVYQWLEGASPTAPCTVNGTIWTCNLSRAGNYYAQAVWDNSSTCLSGSCTSTSYTIPLSPDPNFPFTEYRDLFGNTTAFTNGQTTVNITLQPILIDNNPSY
jgi:Bacterial Ig-like domain (group 2)